MSITHHRQSFPFCRFSTGIPRVCSIRNTAKKKPPGTALRLDLELGHQNISSLPLESSYNYSLHSLAFDRFDQIVFVNSADHFLEFLHHTSNHQPCIQSSLIQPHFASHRIERVITTPSIHHRLVRHDYSSHIHSFLCRHSNLFNLSNHSSLWHLCHNMRSLQDL